jgi:hypothetical protein
MILPRSHRLLLCVAFSWVGILSPLTIVLATAVNTEAPRSEAASTRDEQKDRGHGWRDVILGEPSQNKLYVGMWSDHFLKGNEEYETENNLIGISYGGYFFGTFINSYDDRTWSGGVQRDFYRNRWRRLKLDSGYRAGLLYGYDTITIPDTKLGPLFQVYADVSYRQFGLQFSWALEVVTAGFFVRLP